MTNALWNQLAEILINYSTTTKSGDKVFITMMETETWPLARAVYTQAVKMGAFPYVEYQSAYLERDLMLYGNQAQLDWVTDMQAYGMEWADVYIGLRGARNPHEFTGITADKFSAHKKAMGKISAMRNDLTRWVLVRVPSESLAQQAEMSLDEMMEFFFNATLRDWTVESESYHSIQKVFQAAETVRIIGRDTDLSFSTRGRIYEIADGHLILFGFDGPGQIVLGRVPVLLFQRVGELQADHGLIVGIDLLCLLKEFQPILFLAHGRGDAGLGQGLTKRVVGELLGHEVLEHLVLALGIRLGEDLDANRDVRVVAEALLGVLQQPGRVLGASGLAVPIG